MEEDLIKNVAITSLLYIYSDYQFLIAIGIV